MISIRKILINACNLVVYSLCIYWLFISLNFGLALVASLLLYVLLPFCVVEMQQKASLKHVFLLLLATTTLLLVFLNNYERYFIISLYLFHVAIFFVFYTVLDALHNRVVLSPWEISHASAYFFTVFLTLSFASLLLETYTNFPLTCEYLYETSNQVVDTVAYPLELGQETILSFKKGIVSMSSLSVGDALGVSGHQLLGNVTTGSVGSAIATGQSLGIFGMIDSYKTRLFDQVLADNSSVNMNVCQLLVTEISKKYNDPVFQFSIIFLMFLLFYPFLRTFVYIVEGLTWLVLQLFLALGVYRFGKTVKEVDEVY